MAVTNPRQEFDSLPADKKLELIMPRVQLMIGMLKDTKLNYDKFLIPKGAMNKDSITYKEFCDKYFILFPKERPDEKKSTVTKNDNVDTDRIQNM